MSKLTDWEIGQEFIEISDYIAERLEDVDMKRFPDLLKRLQQARAHLGDALNELGQHEFGIFDSACYKKAFGEDLPKVLDKGAIIRK